MNFKVWLLIKNSIKKKKLFIHDQWQMWTKGFHSLVDCNFVSVSHMWLGINQNIPIKLQSMTTINDGIIVGDANNCSNSKQTPNDDYISNDNNPDGFRIGDFIIARQDVLLDCPAIWRVDSKTLLQKFEPFHINSKTLYRSLSTVSITYSFQSFVLVYMLSHKPSHIRIILMGKQHNYTCGSKHEIFHHNITQKLPCKSSFH